jgi:hypothetical protein
MWPFLLASGALALGKHFFHDKPQERSDAKVAAVTQRYSPWTHMQADKVEHPDLLGSLAQFGTAGAQFGQNMEMADANNEIRKLQLKRFKDLGIDPDRNRGSRVMLGNDDPRFPTGWSGL